MTIEHATARADADDEMLAILIPPLPATSFFQNQPTDLLEPLRGKSERVSMEQRRSRGTVSGHENTSVSGSHLDHISPSNSVD
jgi:hypothetical protein